MARLAADQRMTGDRTCSIWAPASTCSVCGAALQRRQLSECSRACQIAAFRKKMYVYTDEQRAMARALRSQGKSVGLISRETGMHYNAVSHLFRREGIAKPEVLIRVELAGQRSPEQNEIVRRMYAAGDSSEDIREAVNAIGTYRLGNNKRLVEWARNLGVTRPAGWNRTHGAALRLRAMAAKAATRPPAPAPAPRVVRASTQPPVPGSRPRSVSLATLYRIGRELGLDSDDALRVELVSAAQRRADPTHPGYVMETYGRWAA